MSIPKVAVQHMKNKIFIVSS